MGIKYVKCMHSAMVNGKYTDIDGKIVNIQFYPFALNTMTGQPIHTGYTKVTDDELKALRKDSNVFKSFENQKLLVVVDSLPDSAQTPQAVIQDQKQELLALQKELEDAKAALAKAGIKPSGKKGAKEATPEEPSGDAENSAPPQF